MLLFALALAATLGDSMVYRGSARELEIAAPRVEAANVKLDGRLDEPVWQQATVLTGFTQYEPVEGVPATEETEVLVFYTAEAIYFGIRARDRHPEQIRATRGRRDRAVFSDDWVRLMLDTFDDRRQAYVFYVNPLGIQADGLWLEGAERRGSGSGVPIDFNPDFLWHSEGRVTDWGWEAEIRIPFASLRFREKPVQDWGINIAREVKRTGHKQSWAPLTQNQTNQLAQSGRLVGLRDLRPRRLIELNPAATGKRTAERNGTGEFVRGPFQPDFGLNARYGITRNLVLDATLNPDFSQVEADTDQITVNERFAVFFPEKRPFFLEGAEIFQTPQRLVHTRAIVDPIGGAKVTGKLGDFNVGYLSALDESPLTTGAGGGQALFNLVRLRRDIGAGSTVGALYTDRTLLGSGEANRVLGVDTRLLFAERYSLTAQLAGSWTGGGVGAEGEEVAMRFAPLLHAHLERSGRSFSWDLRLSDIGPDFQAQSGFLRRLGDTQLFAGGRYNGFGAPEALLERWGVEVRLDNFFNHEEFWRAHAPKEAEVEVQGSLFLRGRHSLRAVVRNGYFRFEPGDYPGYEIETPEGGLQPFVLPRPLQHLRAVALMPSYQLSQQLQLGGRVLLREIPIYAEARRGAELLFSPDIRYWPTPALNLELSHTRSRIWRQRDESLYSTADISRLRTQYQFSRALSARALVQYNLQSRNALRDPTTEHPLWVRGRRGEAFNRGELGFNLLGSYEPSPGTVVYLGWSRQMTGPETYYVRDLEPRSEGLFLKVSYLFRL